MYFERHPRVGPGNGARRWMGARGAVSPSTPDGRIATLGLVALLTLNGCGPKTGEIGNDLQIQDGVIVVLVNAYRDTVMESTSRVLVQERIDLRRYEPETGIAESGFIDLARYPAFFDSEIWDARQRLVKLRFFATSRDSTTVFECEPLYNPHEIVTDELDSARLRRVPQGHPGFAIAAAITRRIAAHAERRAVASP